MAFRMGDYLLPFAIGCGLLYAGAVLLDRLAPPLWIRVLLGISMFVGSIALMAPLMDSDSELYAFPIRFGVAIALGGLGINQAAAPIRAWLGKPASRHP